MITTDVLVLGAGPAGIAAATAAAEHGCGTVLLDDNLAPGGQIWRSDLSAPTGDPRKQAAMGRLRASGASLHFGWQVFDAPRPGVLRAVAGAKVESFAYRRLVVATGARERFLPFPGWTMPGVFGAGGLDALVKGGFAVAGKRVVVAGSGPLLLAVAVHLRQAGAPLVCVAEQASARQLTRFAPALLRNPGKLLQGIGYRMRLGSAPYRTGCWPVEALGENARPGLRGVRLSDGRNTREEACDLLACGFHLVPNVEVASLLGCALAGGFVTVNDLQQTSIENVYCAGEPTGIGGLEAALVQGRRAGLACAGRISAGGRAQRSAAAFAASLDRAFTLRPELRALARGDTIVCRCEDVRREQLETAATWTEAKLFTRCGMGPCQGRVCGPAVQTIFGWQPGSVQLVRPSIEA